MGATRTELDDCEVRIIFGQSFIHPLRFVVLSLVGDEMSVGGCLSGVSMQMRRNRSFVDRAWLVLCGH